MITIFKIITDTKNPHYIEVDTILDRIKNCKQQKIVDQVRKEKERDPAKSTALKQTLPAICFSGKFSERSLKGCISHSGFIILDFDHTSELQKRKEEVCKHDFVYAAFISPSGDGLKALVRIEANIEKHGGYFRGLKKVFPDLDDTGKDVPRVCFESIDPDIYINKDAVLFTDYIEDYQKAKPLGGNSQIANTNDYALANTALKMIRISADGEKHAELLKASRLMGGFIAGGQIQEGEAERLLENEISARGCNDLAAAKVTIRRGLDHGKQHPILEETKYVQQKQEPIQPDTSTVKSKINTKDNNLDFLVTKEEAEKYMQQKIDGTFKLGNKTGWPALDEYWRFKDCQLNVVQGHEGVGKSTISWYFAVLDAFFNNKSYLIFSGENNTAAVRCRLVEFYACCTIEKMSKEMRAEATKWVGDHFELIKNDESYNYMDMINMCKKVMIKREIDNFIIEPYNVLEKDTRFEASIRLQGTY